MFLKNMLLLSAPKPRGRETSPPDQVGTPEAAERRRPPTLPTPAHIPGPRDNCIFFEIQVRILSNIKAL